MAATPCLSRQSAVTEIVGQQANIRESSGRAVLKHRSESDLGPHPHEMLYCGTSFQELNYSTRMRICGHLRE